jgi:hypothetical protein
VVVLGIHLEGRTLDLEHRYCSIKGRITQFLSEGRQRNPIDPLRQSPHGSGWDGLDLVSQSIDYLCAPEGRRKLR